MPLAHFIRPSSYPGRTTDLPQANLIALSHERILTNTALEPRLEKQGYIFVLVIHVITKLLFMSFNAFSGVYMSGFLVWELFLADAVIYNTVTIKIYFIVQSRPQ